jgi:capsular polysaccharide export protein
VHDDTQIVIHSPWVHTMEQMVQAVVRAREQLGLPHHIVVKEHPVDVGRSDYSSLANVPNLVWLWDYPLDKVMTGADCVITVNSSVGIEAVVRGLPLVTLGNAIYNVEGIAHHAASEQELPACIAAALSQPPDKSFREEFLCRLRFHDLIDAHWARPTDHGVENAAARIVRMLHASNFSGTPTK